MVIDARKTQIGKGAGSQCLQQPLFGGAGSERAGSYLVKKRAKFGRSHRGMQLAFCAKIGI